MSKQAQPLASLLILALCITMLSKPGLAMLRIPQFPPSLIPPGASEEVLQCWSSLLKIPGCGWEIQLSVFGRRYYNLVGPRCCEAFLAVDADCWPRMFPIHPFFPPLFKGYCARIVAPPIPA